MGVQSGQFCLDCCIQTGCCVDRTPKNLHVVLAGAAVGTFLVIYSTGTVNPWIWQNIVNICGATPTKILLQCLNGNWFIELQRTAPGLTCSAPQIQLTVNSCNPLNLTGTLTGDPTSCCVGAITVTVMP